MAGPLMEEEGEVEDRWRSFSTPSWIAPLQVPEPEEGSSVGPGFWPSSQGIWVEQRELPASEKVWGKAPTVEPLPLETNEELVWRLQQEEIAAD